MLGGVPPECQEGESAAPAISLRRGTEMRWCFSTSRVDQTGGSRVGSVSAHAVSMVGCLEEVDVQLETGLSDRGRLG